STPPVLIPLIYYQRPAKKVITKKPSKKLYWPSTLLSIYRAHELLRTSKIVGDKSKTKGTPNNPKETTNELWL
ncbi:MAG: hypothetical protein ACKORE_06605, partial [Bacteroidota bacterium]